jgi:hypothetical protein
MNATGNSQGVEPALAPEDRFNGDAGLGEGGTVEQTDSVDVTDRIKARAQTHLFVYLEIRSCHQFRELRGPILLDSVGVPWPLVPSQFQGPLFRIRERERERLPHIVRFVRAKSIYLPIL